MRVDVFTTFPTMFESVMGTSMMRIAQEKGLLDFHAHDLRRWTHDRHRTTDDEPYGGGSGLVMKCEPIFEAYETLVSDEPHIPDKPYVSDKPHVSHESRPSDGSHSQPHVIFLAPTGVMFTDSKAATLSRNEWLLFVCGHYEGIDERAYTVADEVISLGDYVLTSGELASMVVIDAVVRKIPGVLGAEGGAIDESFHDGLLEYPQYTRPAVVRDLAVPEVLLSGNHGAVDAWRREQSLRRTLTLRPDLLKHAMLSARDWEILKSLSEEEGLSF